MWSYLLAAIGLTGLYLAPKYPAVGWWFNIAAQALWAIYAITTRQWGFLASAAVYALMYVRLLRRAQTTTPAAVAEQ